MKDTVFVLTATQLFKSALCGVFTTREEAEKEEASIKKALKDNWYLGVETDIIEVPFNPTNLVEGWKLKGEEA